MGDLISRAAALEALDHERKVLIEQERYGSEHIVVHHARRMIEELPTIDAIPVKWLRRWRDVTDIPILAMNIDSILKVWEESNKYWGEVNKKQEAR